MTRVALVTGTSSGIGLSTAVALAQAGFTVIATMRNLDKSDALEARMQAAGVDLQILRLDVQDEESIEVCMNYLFLTYGHLDVLVNNAGTGYMHPFEQTMVDDVRQVFDLNFLGVWRVTQSVFSMMRTRGAGRIITLSSLDGVVGQPFSEVYCAVKFATEGMMESLAPLARRFGVYLSLIEPGPVNTNFADSVDYSLGASQVPAYEDYRPLYRAYSAAARAALAGGQSADAVAQVVVEAATAEQPHFRYQTTAEGRELVARKLVDPTGDTVVALASARLPDSV